MARANRCIPSKGLTRGFRKTLILFPPGFPLLIRTPCRNSGLDFWITLSASSSTRKRYKSDFLQVLPRSKKRRVLNFGVYDLIQIFFVGRANCLRKITWNFFRKIQKMAKKSFLMSRMAACKAHNWEAKELMGLIVDPL